MKTYQICGVDIRIVQSQLTRILSEFDKICRNHHLRYSIEGGTLMGAYKFKGFVPWDDDIDVVMPRDDYEQFIQIASTVNNGMSIHTYKNDKKHILNYCKYRMNGTIYKERLNAHLDMDHGLFIDIFPLDRVSLSTCKYQIKAISLFFKIRWYKLGYCSHNFIGNILCGLIPNRLLVSAIDYIARWGNARDGKYFYEVCNANIKFRPIPAQWFHEYIDLDFEGLKVQAVSHYIEYLNARFENLNEMPVEKERKPSHQIIEIKFPC